MNVKRRSRGALRPRFAGKLPALFVRGRREDRVRAAPAVSCATCTEEHAHEHTGSAGASRPSLRNGFTAYFVLSPVSGFLATVTCGYYRKLDASTAASGPHDFAVRYMRARLPRISRPPLPAPNVRDDREAPLLWARDGDNCSFDLPDGESGIFLREEVDRVLD